MAKHFVANALGRIIDRAIQVHGALGYSTDTPLAHMYQHARWARFADGAGRGAPDADRAAHDRRLQGARQQPDGDRRPAGLTARPAMRRRPRVSRAAIALLLVAACQRTTGTLSEEQQHRFETEGIVRRAVDVLFRYSHDGGTRDAGWEEDDASIVVTKESVVIHRGDRFRLEITPRSTGVYEVARDHDRLRLHAGSGKSAVSWSFRPPDDAPGWAEDIRAVIRGTAGAARRQHPH